MASVTRVTKASAGGGTEFADDTPALAAEVNAEFNTLFDALQGNLNDTNIDTLSWSKISGTKNPEDIDDTSGSASERDTIQAPGTSFPYRDNPTLPTNLEDELQQLRHQIQRVSIGLAAKFFDGSAAGTASWPESGALGTNLIRNSMFQIFTGASNAAPDGWSKVGTPSTIQLANTTAAEGGGKEVNIVSAGSAADGIEQTVSGLKADTLYLVVARVNVTAGKCHLITNGGASSGSFQDMAEDHASSATTGSYETLAAIVSTDSTPTDIDVEILADTDATADEFNIRYVRMHEIGDDLPASLPVLPVIATTSFQSTNRFSSASFNTFVTDGSPTDLEAAITIPTSNYAIVVLAWGSVEVEDAATSGNQQAIVMRVLENGSEAGRFASAVAAGGADEPHTAFGFYMNVSPSADTTYTYKIDAKVQDTADQNPTDLDGTASESGIIAVAIPLGG